jgi:Flp pilus assembly protein CpaB
MEATSVSKKVGGSSPRDILSTRRGALTIAALAAVLAGILLYAFVQKYRSNQNASAAPTTVFVATSFIPAGSSADVIASQQLLQRTSVRGSQAQSGAISEPSVLHGEVAVTNIYPGQQITAADFTTSHTIASDLGSTQRAVAVPVDTAHGLVGYVHTGDYVDVLASFPGGAGNSHGSVTTLVSNVLVLSAPGGSSGITSNNSNVVLLRVGSREAASIAYAADNGKVWVVLRPPLGATQSEASASAAKPSEASTATETGGH